MQKGGIIAFVLLLVLVMALVSEVSLTGEAAGVPIKRYRPDERGVPVVRGELKQMTSGKEDSYSFRKGIFNAPSNPIYCDNIAQLRVETEEIREIIPQAQGDDEVVVYADMIIGRGKGSCTFADRIRREYVEGTRIVYDVKTGSVAVIGSTSRDRLGFLGAYRKFREGTKECKPSLDRKRDIEIYPADVQRYSKVGVDTYFECGGDLLVNAAVYRDGVLLEKIPLHYAGLVKSGERAGKDHYWNSFYAHRPGKYSVVIRYGYA